MHKVKHDHLPEVHERKTFPFKASNPPSPADSRLSTPALSRTTRQARDNAHKTTLTMHGIEFSNEAGPAARSRSTPSVRSRGLDGYSSRGDMAGLDTSHRGHTYAAGHEFGHHCTANNVNPFLAHYRIPKWQTTNDMYGTHYRHPEQTYARPMKNRMPVFQIHL
mmetsp:Transcript_78857/g.124517  ORF Transcript_78857/g.124517 Transcript_78857/m.124517 type:complete len:164 (-) Transcript_78857:69-560(-)